MRRGEFRFLILITLKEKPMHGYALIQEIGRTYQRPVSAGLVYPTLQELEDMGLVESEEKDGKRTYSVTANGKRYLAENEEIVGRLSEGREYAGRLGRFSSLGDLRDMRAMLMMSADDLDEEKMQKIQEATAEAKKKIAAIVFG